jgi:hypothetical protein
MKAFRTPLIAVVTLWIICGIFLAVDLAGPILGAPPPAKTTVDSSLSTPIPQPTPTNSKNSGKTQKKPDENAGSGLLYPATRHIPKTVNDIYSYHFFIFPLPLLLTILLVRHISGLKKAQRARMDEIAANSVTVSINPPVSDTTPFSKSWLLLDDFFNVFSGIPGNRPDMRQRGLGVYFSLGYSSRVGDGIRMTARIPTPLNQSPARRKKAPIPQGLPSEIINIVSSRYDYVEVKAQPPEYDHLDLDAIKDSKFTLRRKGIQGRVQAYKLLKLASPAFMPINAEDNTAAIYQKLNLASDSGLSACGIEIVLLPASEWHKDAEKQLQLLFASETSQQVAGRQATAGKTLNTSRAAQAKANLTGVKTQREAIAKKHEVRGGYCTFVYLWAEGNQVAVQNKLESLINIFTAYSIDPSSMTGAGNRFQVIGSGQGLTEVRRRAYPVFFTPEISVLNSQELSALWYLPNKDVKRGPERAGAMSPPPAIPVIHSTTLPDGTKYNSDDSWRLILGTYTQPDGTKLEVGISEQSCLRGAQITGRPGSGKSVDLQNIIVQGMTRSDGANKGKGGSDLLNNSFVAADPNGDFANDTLKTTPDHMEDKIAVIDPSDKERVAGLNPMALPDKRLEPETIEAIVGTIGQSLGDDFRRQLQEITKKGIEQDGAAGFVASQMLEVFAKTQGVSIDNTPNIYRVLSNSLRVAVEVSGTSTIWTLLRMINDAPYREAMVSRSRDPIATNFFREEFANLADKGGGEKLASTRSRLENLLRQEVIRRLLTQRNRTVNIREFIDKGWGIMFRFPPTLGSDKPFLLAVTFNLVKQAVFSRADIRDKNQRRTVHVLLDEFQEMVGTDSATLQIWLEQARKFGGAIVLAHQNLSQVKALLEAIKGTIGNLVPMLLGPDDVKFYSGYLGSSEFTSEQLFRTFTNLPKYSKVAKLYDDGQDFAPVLLNSLPLLTEYAPEKPLLIAIPDEAAVYGYRLEQFVPERHSDLIAPHKALYAPTAKGEQHGVRPTTPDYCTNLIEELTDFLHRKDALKWGYYPFDLKGVQLGLELENAQATLETVRRMNRDSDEVRQAQELLLGIERLRPIEREDYLTGLDEETWQRYRMARKSRDMELRKVIVANRGLIPDKLNRINTLSRLWVGTPVPEIEAETKRPDDFTLEAEQIRQRMLEEAAQEEEGGGKKKGKKKAVTV